MRPILTEEMVRDILQHRIGYACKTARGVRVTLWGMGSPVITTVEQARELRERFDARRMEMVKDDARYSAYLRGEAAR